MLLYWLHPNALVSTGVSICATAYSSLRTACRRLQALSALPFCLFPYLRIVLAESD